MLNPIQDVSLSWKARGLYAYMKKYGKKKTSARQLTQMTRDGRDSTLTAIKELRDAGYLRLERHNDGSVTYHLL